MSDENPLETAQRVWPGAWKMSHDQDGLLHLHREWARSMGPATPRLATGSVEMRLTIHIYQAPNKLWLGGYTLQYTTSCIAVGTFLDQTLIDTREAAQGLARSLALSMGLEVRDGRAE